MHRKGLFTAIAAWTNKRWRWKHAWSVRCHCVNSMSWTTWRCRCSLDTPWSSLCMTSRRGSAPSTTMRCCGSTARRPGATSATCAPWRASSRAWPLRPALSCGDSWLWVIKNRLPARLLQEESWHYDNKGYTRVGLQGLVAVIAVAYRKQSGSFLQLSALQRNRIFWSLTIGLWHWPTASPFSHSLSS